MTCTNCRKPITGRVYERTGSRTVNGTVNRTKDTVIRNCEACQKQIEADEEASKLRAVQELNDLKKRFGL